VIPLLEAASLQDDDELIERWAGLLANATDPAGSPVEPGFPDVLRQLSPVDARLFDYIVLRGHQVVQDRWFLRPLHRGEIKHSGPVKDDDAFSVALENLLRVRLVVEVPMLREKRGGGQIGLTFDDERIKLSSYGAKFAKAVHRGDVEQELGGPPAQSE
jgi:Abortive infection alpha